MGLHSAAVWLLAIIFSPGAIAQYRCVENGKTTFSDKPCVAEVKPVTPIGNAPKILGDNNNSAYGSPYGDWRGDAQYQARVNGALVSDAHTVIPMTISISPQGKVLGISEQNQCRMKGIASPGIMPNSLSLDVTFSGCGYPGYNQRMGGYLNLNAAQKQVQLSLNGFVIQSLGRGSEQYDIRATMRR
jgi:hypothetical protein